MAPSLIEQVLQWVHDLILLVMEIILPAVDAFASFM